MPDPFSYAFPHRALTRTDALNRVDVAILFRDAARVVADPGAQREFAGARVAVWVEDETERAAFAEVLGAAVVVSNQPPAPDVFAAALEALGPVDLLVLGVGPELVGAAALVRRLGVPSALAVHEGARDRPPEALSQAFALAAGFAADRAVPPERLVEALEGGRIALVGDPAGSPLLRAHASLLQLLGARPTVVAPPDADTPPLEAWGLAAAPLDATLAAVDGMIALDAAGPPPCGLARVRRRFEDDVAAMLAEAARTRPVLAPAPTSPHGLAMRAALVAALLGRAEAMFP